jgi:hypothetical protein
LRVHDTGFSRLEVFSADGHFMSTAVTGQTACATIDKFADDTIGNLARVLKTTLTTPTVEANISSHVKTEQQAKFVKGQAVILLDYHRTHTGFKPDCSYPLGQHVRRYQFGKYQDEAKPSLVSFMPPILDECFAPDKTVGNERRAVKERITDVANEKPMTPFLLQVVDEFVTRFFPHPHSLRPVDQDEIHARQDTPTQRRLIHLAENIFPDRLIKFFLKTEAYAKPAAPRIISPINPVDKVEYSKYMYPLSDYLKTMSWYAFGHNPSQIAIRVAEICQSSQTVTKTDFSKYDGTVGPALRVLERQVLVRAFPTSELNQIHDYHSSQYNLRAIGPFGTKYDSAYARASGSPETAAFNSIDNAFTCFLALRLSENDHGTFYNADQAWLHLCTRCLFGGDDGLVGDLAPVKLIAASNDLGLNIRADPVQRGSFGVQFLARVYGPNVWFGDPSSCCDLPRQLSKLHASQPLPSNVTPEMKLCDKTLGYLASDSNTPIMGDYCQTVHNILQPNFTLPTGLKSYTADLPLDVQYPNEYGDWMQAYAHESLPEFDFERFNRWIHSVNTPSELMNPPIFREKRAFVPPSVPIVVDSTSYQPLDRVKKTRAAKPTNRSQKFSGRAPPVAANKRRASATGGS